MTNLPCECQELKPKGETNSSFLVLHPLSGVHTVKTVGSHLKSTSTVEVHVRLRRFSKERYRQAMVWTMDRYFERPRFSFFKTAGKAIL